MLGFNNQACHALGWMWLNSEPYVMILLETTFSSLEELKDLSNILGLFLDVVDVIKFSKTLKKNKKVKAKERSCLAQTQGMEH